MFIYQAVIMAAVVIAIYLLAFIVKMKRRKLLVVSMVAILVIGGGALYYVQYFFSNHYYTQEISTAEVEKITFPQMNEAKLKEIFTDYSEENDPKTNSDVLTKTYKISANGADSTIAANIYVFTNSADADQYFSAGQHFYDNKNYIPLDELQSKKDGDGTRYLISGIKSQYQDYTDILYLPSKINYCSDVVIESDNVIINLSETSNKPVTNKQKVFDDILSKINK